jgi:hypothetical protein
MVTTADMGRVIMADMPPPTMADMLLTIVMGMAIGECIVPPTLTMAGRAFMAADTEVGVTTGEPRRRKSPLKSNSGNHRCPQDQCPATVLAPWRGFSMTSKRFRSLFASAFPNLLEQNRRYPRLFLAGRRANSAVRVHLAKGQGLDFNGIQVFAAFALDALTGTPGF